jgi:two-component sensor histidine kinase
MIRIVDNGNGLPEGFSLEQAHNLGLQIVQTLVRDDLKGTFSLCQEDGVVAEVSFLKLPLGG